MHKQDNRTIRFTKDFRRRLSLALTLAVAVNVSYLPYALADDLSTPIIPALKMEQPIVDHDKTPKNSPLPDTMSGASTELPTDAAPATDSSAAVGSVAADPSNPNLTVDDVKIEGNRLVATEDIMHVVKTHRGDKFDRDQVMQDLKAINGMGYFDDRSLQVTPELTTGGVLLKIRVQENAPVTEFSFQGNKVLSSEEISKVFSDQLGKPQNLNQLSSAIDKVEQAYHDKGYILSRVTDVKDDPDGSIGLTVNEGVLDDIQIVGNKKTLDQVVRQYLKGLHPGSVYNDKILSADLKKLYGAGYFSDIRRSLTPSTKDPDKFTLKVEVDEKRSGSVGLGGGMDTLYGPFGSLNLSDNNFMGKGQTLSFNGMVGSTLYGSLTNTLNNGGTQFVPNVRTYNLQANFIQPHLFGTDVSMDDSAYGRALPSMLITGAMQQTIGAGTTFNKNLGHHFSLSLGMNAQNTSLTNELASSDETTLLNQVENRALLTGMAQTSQQAQTIAQNARAQQLKGGAYASINPTLAFDTRDNATDPTEGTLARLTSTPSLGLGSASFIKLGASLSEYVPMPASTTLALNTQAGTSFGGLMPQFAQYNLGGFNGLRGYRQFTDLGTGTGILMGTAELRGHLPFIHHSENKVLKMIDKHIKWDTFVDAGQVTGNGTSDSLFSRSALGASVGFGVRVNLPMLGTIRLDYGFPLLNSIQGGLTPRFTVGFGNSF